MLESLFSEMSLPVRFFIAFLFVLGLIGLFAWMARRFGAERLGAATARGRQPRLAVIDAAAVDGRRRLILIRRDNIEHLLMIGGPSDVVIEANIVRAVAQPREAPPPARASETFTRAAALNEGSGWPLQPEPAPPARPQRVPPTEEPGSWPAEPELPAPPRRQPRPADPLAGLAAELGRAGEPRIPMPGDLGAAGPRDPREPPRQRENARERDMARELTAEREPVRPRENAREREAEREPVREPAREREAPREREPPRIREPQPPPVAAEAPFDAEADQNLADMAQRLEAALRRPGKPAEPRPAEGAPRPAPANAANAESAPPAPARSPASTEGSLARAEAKPARSLYDSLEKEMASLLGRPGGKT